MPATSQILRLDLIPIKIVLRRDNALDLGRILGLLKCQRADKNVLVRNRAGDTLQLSQLTMSETGLLENRLVLKIKL